MYLQRQNKNFFNNWWWTIDHLTLIALGIIIAFSALMVATASPAVAERIGLESYYFIRRQLVYLAVSLVIIFSISSFSPKHLKIFSFLGFVACFVLLILVLIKGTEVKGAKRWLYIFGFSMQPSEFIKPFFAVLTGWILAIRFNDETFPSFKISIITYVLLVTLLILQPDFGMVITVSVVWAGQLFLAGLPLIYIAAMFIFSLFGVVSAYIFLPHVSKRINSFFDPSSNENYQVKRSIEAFVNGGFYGKGPGEGTVKQVLPDSHTDFIFAVVGEELGMIACLCVIMLFAFVVIRGFYRISQETDLSIAFAATGLLMQFGMQSIINMGVTLHLLPTKGMTLPFISYGGSSMFATSISVGMILAMTRKRYGFVKIGSRGYRLWMRD